MGAARVAVVMVVVMVAGLAGEGMAEAVAVLDEVEVAQAMVVQEEGRAAVQGVEVWVGVVVEMEEETERASESTVDSRGTEETVVESVVGRWEGAEMVADLEMVGMASAAEEAPARASSPLHSSKSNAR